MSYAKPENALQRAQELLAVSPNQKDEALKQLRSVISKRTRTWQKPLEDLMMLYIDLCVQLRRGKEAKDGLHQYRSICQQTNIASLGTVIKHFLELAEHHAKEAQSKAEKITLDIEDLDAEEAPESVMLGKVSGEDTKDRTDRQIVTPWLKLLWETYRTVLDILRNNAKLETLYHYTAQQAFNFCKSYKRNTEFKRMCEILRLHIANLTKSTQTANAVSLASPESLGFHLETRFTQLNVACELELWQEAFRSIEDLHALMLMAKRPPKPQLLANYYEKLARVFLVSENYILHAYALYKFYTLSKNQNKNLSADDLKQMASTVVVAALSIPVDTPKVGEEMGGTEIETSPKEKLKRLASLLGPGTRPSRESLLSELNTKGITSSVVPELVTLYEITETRFQPLKYCENLKPQFEFIASHPNLKQYLCPLQSNVFIRLLQQLSRVYGILQMSNVAQLAYFLDSREVERRIVEAAHVGHIQAKIDHQNKTLNFISDPAGLDALRGQLRTLSHSLMKVANLIHPNRDTERAQRKKELFAQTLKSIGEEHARVLERRRIIERRKEIREQMANLRAAAAAAVLRKEEEQRRAAAAAARAEQLKKRAEEEKKKKEEEMERNRIKRELETLSKLAKGSVNITEELLQKVDQEQVDAKQVLESKKAELKRAKKEAENKLNTLSKRLDHLERAMREEERPLLEQFYQALQKEDRTAYDAQVASYRESHEKAHAKEVEEKKRLGRMASDRAVFEERFLKRRTEEYNRLKAAQDERLVGIRAEIEKQKEIKRKESEELKRKAEEKERQRREEEEQLEKLEEERRKKLKEERCKKLEEERCKKLEEERRQQEKEAEAVAAVSASASEEEHRREEAARQEEEEEEERRREKASRADERHHSDERPRGDEWRRPTAGRDPRAPTRREENDWRGSRPAEKGQGRRESELQGDGAGERDQEGRGGYWRGGPPARERPDSGRSDRYGAGPPAREQPSYARGDRDGGDWRGPRGGGRDAPSGVRPLEDRRNAEPQQIGRADTWESVRTGRRGRP